MSYVFQREFPLPGSPWNPGEPDFTNFRPPTRRGDTGIVESPAAKTVGAGDPVVTVLGTVRNEAQALERSLSIWTRQVLPDGIKAELLVLDDGSNDDPLGVVHRYRKVCGDGPLRIRYVRVREPGGSQRNCTLVFNMAVRQLVRTPLVLFQWWDRIPGSFIHLTQLVVPHLGQGTIVTSAISRHLGGSSSVDAMRPVELEVLLKLVDWRDDPGKLATVAGRIGNHCIPGQATESSGFCLPIDEFVALGGYDERYTARANYSNVELWRRILQGGLQAWFVEEPEGANYHQSHPCPTGRVKDHGVLDDLRVRRNVGRDWGAMPYLEEL